MKTLRRKLFLSILAVAFAVVSLATSTFAWFALNDTVAVQDMTVTVNSDYAFLLIGTGDQAYTAIQTAKTKTVAPKTANANIYPAAHENTVNNITTADTPANWYYMYSDKTDVSTGVAETKTALTADGDHPMSKYVLVNEFHLTLAPGSKEMGSLKVKDFSMTVPSGGLDAVKVVIAGDAGVQELDKENVVNTSGMEASAVTTLLNGRTVLSDSITDAKATSVKVYIYVDGNDADVTTDNVTSLKGATVNFTLTAAIKNA